MKQTSTEEWSTLVLVDQTILLFSGNDFAVQWIALQ
jgi:hypothetical protein